MNTYTCDSVSLVVFYDLAIALGSLKERKKKKKKERRKRKKMNNLRGRRIQLTTLETLVRSVQGL